MSSGWMTSDHAGPGFQRPAPPEYLDKYAALPISSSTAQLYAMLEYVDSQVGRGRARQNTAAAAALATVFADVARRRFWCVQQPQLACKAPRSLDDRRYVCLCCHTGRAAACLA